MRSLVDAKGLLAGLIIICYFSTVAAFEVAPNSPCSSICNRPKADWSSAKASSTQTSDVMCSDTSFGGSNSTTAGRQWRGCMACLQNSNYVSKVNGEADLFWFIFNMRFSFDWCVLGFTTVVNPVVDSSQACSGACSSLTNAFTDQVTSSNMTRLYTYCDTSYGVTPEEYDACGTCLQSLPNAQTLSNYVDALGSACAQKPSPGNVLTLNSSVVVGSDNSTEIAALADTSTELSTTQPGNNSESESTGSTSPLISNTVSTSASVSASLRTSAIIGVGSALAGVVFASGTLLLFIRRQNRISSKEAHERKVAENDRRFSSPDGFDMPPNGDGLVKPDMRSLVIEISTPDKELDFPAQLSSRNYDEKALSVEPIEEALDRKHSIYEMA